MMQHLLCTLSLAFTAACVSAQSVSALPASEAAAPAVNFSYVPGKTTEQQAMEYWQQSGAQVLGKGHLALGTGQGLDNVSQAYHKDVVLMDVQGVDFEGLPKARFVFYKGTLYSIQVRLRTLLRKGETQPYTDEQVAQLRRRLEIKHGQPRERKKTLFADGKEPDLLIWHLGGSTMRLQLSSMNTILVYGDPKIEQQVKKSIPSVCKEFNTKERIICW